MKDKKKILLIIAGIIIVLIILTIVLVNKINTTNNSNVKNDYTENVEEVCAAEYYNIIVTDDIDNSLKGTDETKKVYNINLSDLYINALGSVEVFNSRLGSIYDEEHSLNQDDNTPDMDFKKAVYSCLDPIYIKNTSITEENVNQMAGHYEFVPTKGFKSSQINQIIILFGNRIDIDNKTQEEYGYIVQINEGSKAFSIIPYDFMKKAGITSLQEGNIINLNENTKVEPKENNYYAPINSDIKSIASTYLKIFKLSALNKSDLAYERLTIDNKKKYGSADNFSKYLNNNYEKFNSIKIITVTESKKDDYYTYKCLDANGNEFYIQINYNNALEYYIELSNILF